MSLERKSISVKVGDTGEVEAVFSNFDTVDSDGDIVTREALLPHNGERVMMVTNHDWSVEGWVGDGHISVGDKNAKFSGQFLMDDPGAQSAYRKVKAFQGLSEWSWSFEVGDATYEERDGKPVRVIKSLKRKPFEVSPVLVGANPGTRTLGVKAALAEVLTEEPIKAAIRELVLKALDEERERRDSPPDREPEQEPVSAPQVEVDIDVESAAEQEESTPPEPEEKRVEGPSDEQKSGDVDLQRTMENTTRLLDPSLWQAIQNTKLMSDLYPPKEATE